MKMFPEGVTLMQVCRIAMRGWMLACVAWCGMGLNASAQTAPERARLDQVDRVERVWALTDQSELMSFRPAQPDQILSRRPVTGLAAGDALVGMDFRVSRGVLYALSRAGRLYTLATDSATLSLVGEFEPKSVAALGRKHPATTDRGCVKTPPSLA